MGASQLHCLVLATLTAVALLAPGSACAQVPPPLQGCPVGGYPIIACPVVNDQVIAGAVRVRLSGVVVTPTDRVTITVTNGVVTLTGQVDDMGRQAMAGALAGSVRGVVAVHNQLGLSPATEEDQRLLVQVQRALRKAAINPILIRVDVTNRVVRLRGMVENEYQRDQAELWAEGVPGVDYVQNDLIVQEIGIES